MISDPASLKYILNSPHFRRGPLKDSTAHLLFGDKSITTVNGRFSHSIRLGMYTTQVLTESFYRAQS
jgi:hypothetical protein